MSLTFNITNYFNISEGRHYTRNKYDGGLSDSDTVVTYGSYEGYVKSYGATVSGFSVPSANAEEASTACLVGGFKNSSPSAGSPGSASRTVWHFDQAYILSGTLASSVQADLSLPKTGSYTDANNQEFGMVGVHLCGEDTNIRRYTADPDRLTYDVMNAPTGYVLSLTSYHEGSGLNTYDPVNGGAVGWVLHTRQDDPTTGLIRSGVPSAVLCTNFLDGDQEAVPVTAGTMHRVKLECDHQASQDVLSAYYYDTNQDAWRQIGPLGGDPTELTVLNSNNHYWPRGSAATAGLIMEWNEGTGVGNDKVGWFAFDNFITCIDAVCHTVNFSDGDGASADAWNTGFENLGTSLDAADIADRDITRGPFTLHLDAGNLGAAASKEIWFRAPCNAAIRGMAVLANSSSSGNFTLALTGAAEPDLLDQGDGLSVVEAHSGGGGIENSVEGWLVNEWRYLRRGVLYKLTVTNGTGAAAETTASINLLPMRTKF